MKDFIFIYMTCADENEGRRICAALLDRRLIACANIMPPHVALYEWQGKREESREVAVIMKGRADMFDDIHALACELHSYECPCIVALPITDGHHPYMQWLAAQTAL